MLKQSRRIFLKNVGVGLASAAIMSASRVEGAKKAVKKPNVVFVFADQWRAQATGYAGDPNVKTPNVDRFSRESVNFANAVSSCPVCSPYRASLLTGQYPLTHGVFVNDVCLDNGATSIAEVLKSGGYDTAYISKWHIDGHGRLSFIPKERRQGFDYWKVMECTHDYNNSFYYGDTPEQKKWDGYDAHAQTIDAVEYIKSRKPGDKPFALFLSWGPPHNPYETAPEEFKKLYDPEKIVLRPNVPKEDADWSRKDLAGYYAHISALDSYFGRVLDAVKSSGFEEDTIVVFTSDHGDMLGSQGESRKQRPWNESIMVPFLLRYPAKLGHSAKTITRPIGTPDIMPTLLSLCGLKSPKEIEGKDFTSVIYGESQSKSGSTLIACYVPFHEWSRKNGGREYRGLRTERYTYVRDLKGPWLLYDNLNDPYQLRNLCNKPELKDVRNTLDRNLTQKLKELGDEFLPGDEYVRTWKYDASKL